MSIFICSTLLLIDINNYQHSTNIDNLLLLCIYIIKSQSIRGLQHFIHHLLHLPMLVQHIQEGKDRFQTIRVVLFYCVWKPMVYAYRNYFPHRYGYGNKYRLFSMDDKLIKNIYLEKVCGKDKILPIFSLHEGHIMFGSKYQNMIKV